MKKFPPGFRTTVLCLAILILGFLLRIYNLTPFKYYPDAYQNLLVAENIRTHGSVAGFLGEGGYFFPPYISWTHPVYPLLINLSTLFINNPEKSAQLMTLLFGILAIPLTYVFIINIFHTKLEARNSKFEALAAALLLAVSFNHSVWSGTIMTETTGVFFLLLFLTNLINTPDKKPSKAKDLVTGLLFGLSIMTRYEYAILAVPVGIYLFMKSKLLIRFLYIGISAALTVLLFLVRFFPTGDALAGFLNQTETLLKVSLVIVIVTISGIALLKFFIRKQHSISFPFRYLFRLLFLLCALLTFSISVFGFPQLSIFQSYPGLYGFLIHDPLLGILAPLGIFYLLGNSANDPNTIFVTASVFLLNIFYYRTNPTMERYLTHSIPFLLIPAAYAVNRIISIRQSLNGKLVLAAFSILLLFQIHKTANGYRLEKSGAFSKPSYEEVSAKKVAAMYSNTSVLLLTAFPEPYYFYTHLPTQSISDTPPFVFPLTDEQPDRKIIIIEDMAMRDVFPNFSSFLESNMSKSATQTFLTGTEFVYVTHSIQETKPVILYETTVAELRQKTGL